MGLSNLYNYIMTLVHQNFYDKEDIDETIGDINNFIDSSHSNIYSSEVIDTITDNDLRAITSNAVYDGLATHTIDDSSHPNKVNKSDITDNLVSNYADKPLSAKQGKILDEKLNAGIINFFNGSGILIDTNLTISADNYYVAKEENITISGTLSASYDDNDDMTGIISGANIKIYADNILVDTVTTDNTGAYTATLSLDDVGDYSIKAVYEGINNVYDSAESTTLTVYAGLDTSITINVPLNLTYTDNFNITGTLTDEENTALNGKTIKLLIGNTIVDTSITNSNGEFTFSTTPVHTGTHTFQVKFEGDSVYGYATSSTVTREVGKETSVLNITSPINNDNLYSDGTLTISGTLTTDDAEAISSVNVLVQQNNSTISTLTTTSNGSFSGTINGSSITTGTLTIMYTGDDNYTSSSNTISIIVNTPSLVLTSDKSILSYADSESATLTATYTGASVTGKTVSFDIVENGSVVENIDTATTDSNGVCSVTYQSEGVGDIEFTAQCGNILSETYEIEDCYRYNTLTSNDGLFTATTGNPTVSYSNNGLSVTGTGFGDIYSYDGTLPSDFSVECTLQAFTLGLYSVSGELDVNGVGIALRDYNGYHINVYYNNGGSFVETAYVTPPFALKFVANGSNVSVYLNNTLLSTQSKGDTGIWFKLFTDRGITIKNLKIKSL